MLVHTLLSADSPGSKASGCEALVKVGPLQLKPGVGRTVGVAAVSGPESRSWRLYRWAGLACLAGVLFLCQELGRHVLELQALGGVTTSSGWLNLSGAALPAIWLYWLGHAWAVAFLGVPKLRSAVGRGGWLLWGLLAVGLLTVHAILLGPLRGWVVEPRVT